MTDQTEKQTIEMIGTAIAQAWRSGVSIRAEPLPQLPDQKAAYAVQQWVAAGLQWSASPTERRLWKVGGPSAQSIPTAACLPESLTHESGVRLVWDQPGLIGIEPEVAFRIAQVEITSGSAQVQVDACCVAIEVVASRFADADKLDPLLKLADQQMNAALVLGPWQPLPDKPWESHVCTSTFNGRMLAESASGHPCGDPLWALSWLAGHAQTVGQALRAGDVVTTGSWLGMLPIGEPGLLEARFDGLGCANVQFT